MLLFLIICMAFLQVIWFVTDPRPLFQRIRYLYGKNSLSLLLLEIGLLTPQIISSLYFPLDLGSYTPFVQNFGIVLFVIGYFFSIWSKLTMNIFWGPPVEHDKKRQTKLLTSGPFSISRNPIYVGLILVALGFSLAVKSIFFPLIIILIHYFNKAAIAEEKNLEKIFKKEYTRYKSRVPRFIWKI